MFARNFNDAVDRSVYELPDKTLIELSKEILDVPETLFTPDEVRKNKREL